MASENSDPNVVGQKGRVKQLIIFFENMKIPSESQRGFSTPKALAFALDRKRFINKGKGSANVDVSGGGQENNHNDGERWAMAMAVTADQRPLAERRPNTNVLSLSAAASSSSSSSSGGGDFEQSNHNVCDDQSDYTQSSQSTERSECSFGGRRRCKKDFSVERGSQSPLWNWKWKKEVRVTPAQPFRLRTEQRGQIKEEQFTKKIQKMLNEEKRHRIPVAKGLPWTTDEPQVLQKPFVKEQTKPLNVKLHTTTRAIERAQFDHLMEQKLNFHQLKKLAEERLRKVIQEEEIKRLRKEMIPYAQLMPYFDRPFVPKKSAKSPTIPNEPKFQKVHPWKCLSKYD